MSVVTSVNAQWACIASIRRALHSNSDTLLNIYYCSSSCCFSRHACAEVAQAYCYNSVLSVTSVCNF